MGRRNSSSHLARKWGGLDWSGLGFRVNWSYGMVLNRFRTRCLGLAVLNTWIGILALLKLLFVFFVLRGPENQGQEPKVMYLLGPDNYAPLPQLAWPNLGPRNSDSPSYLAYSKTSTDFGGDPCIFLGGGDSVSPAGNVQLVANVEKGNFLSGLARGKVQPCGWRFFSHQTYEKSYEVQEFRE